MQKEFTNLTRNDLPRIYQNQGYKVGVEVGVYKGRFTKLLCESGFKVYAVDPWAVYDDFYDGVIEYPGMDRNIDIQEQQEKLNELYRIASHRLSKYPNCTIVRKTSMEAVKDFENESIDFVYIDGNHFFKYVVEDIWEWSKKVRKGGIVSGDDYLNREDCPCHVKYAVDSYTQLLGITDWYVLGAKFPPSWFWFRQ